MLEGTYMNVYVCNGPRTTSDTVHQALSTLFCDPCLIGPGLTHKIILAGQQASDLPISGSPVPVL